LNNFRIIFKYNYFIIFVINIFYFIIISLLSLLTNMDMKRQINIFLMFIIFILIEIRFDIDINNDELLIIIL